MDEISVMEIETADRTGLPYVLTMAVHHGRVFYLTVEVNRAPYPYFDVDFTSYKGA